MQRAVGLSWLRARYRGATNAATLPPCGELPSYGHYLHSRRGAYQFLDSPRRAVGTVGLERRAHALCRGVHASPLPVQRVPRGGVSQPRQACSDPIQRRLRRHRAQPRTAQAYREHAIRWQASSDVPRGCRPPRLRRLPPPLYHLRSRAHDQTRTPRQRHTMVRLTTQNTTKRAGTPICDDKPQKQRKYTNRQKQPLKTKIL